MLGQLLDEEEERRVPTIRWSDEERVFAMASFPGNRLVTGGNRNGDIVLWDGRTGSQEYVLSGHTDAVLAVVAMPDQGLMYSAGADSTVRVWNLDTLQNTMVFEGHRGFVVGLWASSVDAVTGLFSGSDDRTVKQWNINSGTCVHTFKGHKGPVNCICGTETHLFSGSSDGLLKVWEMASRRCVRTIEAHRDAIWSMCLLPDGRLVTGSTDASIKIWEDLVESANVLTELHRHRGKIRRLIFYGEILFSAGADATINVWNLESSSLIETLMIHDKQVSGLTLENNQLCSCGFDRLICRWDVADLLPSKQKIQPFQPLSVVRAKELEAAQQKVNQINMLKNRRKAREKTPEEIVEMYNELPINFVVDGLDFKVQASRLMFEAVFYIPFLICFVFVFLLNRPIEDSFYMSSGIAGLTRFKPLPSFKQDRFFETVTDIFWFEKWMEIVVRELWMDDSPGGIPAMQQTLLTWPTVIGQNILIGALRIRQQRVHDASCTFNKKFVSNDTAFLQALGSAAWGTGGQLPCYGLLTEAGMEKSPFMCPVTAPTCKVTNSSLSDLGIPFGGQFLYNSQIGTSVVGQLTSYEAGGYGFDLPFNESKTVIAQKVKALFQLGFFDDVATRYIDLTFFVYNPAIDIFLHVQHIFELPSGGTWIPVSRETAFGVFTLRNKGFLVFEFFFFIFMLVFVGIFIDEARNENRKGRLLGFFFNWWNLMEFFNLLFFHIMFFYRWVWMSASNALAKDEILEGSEFPEELESLQDNFKFQIWFNAVNTILTFLKLLKYVRLNDRLNILTRTLDATSQSLSGVLILFVYVVTAFAIGANSLYGNNLFTFRSLDASYVSLLRTLLGDFDYAAMSIENREVTVAFFWAFNILCLFILLNFLVAVISDGFADVSKQRSSVTIDQAIVKVFDDARFECLPKSIRLKTVLLRHFRTTTSVIRDIHEELLRRRLKMVDLAAAQRHDFDELDNVMLHKEDFMSLIPDHFRDFLAQNEEFIEEVWKDMAWEYHHNQLAKNGQQQRERELLVYEEISQALRGLNASFAVMENIQRRLELQEAKLRPFANTLGVCI